MRHVSVYNMAAIVWTGRVFRHTPVVVSLCCLGFILISSERLRHKWGIFGVLKGGN